MTRKPRIAMVLGNVHRPLTLAALKETVAGTDLALVGELREEDGVFTAQLDDGYMLGIIWAAKPIPGTEFTQLRDAAPYWPGAGDDLDAHSAHVIVSIIRDEPGDAVAELRRLSHAVLAVARAMAAAGVYWAQAPHVIRTDVFEEIVKAAADEETEPIALWVAIDLARTGEGTFSALTRGLHAVDHPEVWLTSEKLPPEDLWGLTLNVASYVVTSGQPLTVGDTLGGGPDERVLVEEAPHPGGADSTVLRLAFP